MKKWHPMSWQAHILGFLLFAGGIALMIAIPSLLHVWLD